MLTPETTTEGLRLFAEAVMAVWTVFTAKKEIQKRRKRAPLSIASEEEEDQGDRRGPVRRSELNILTRKLTDLVEKVDDLVDAVTDHQNRLDELDAHRGEMAAALRDLTEAIGGIRGDIAKLRSNA